MRIPKKVLIIGTVAAITYRHANSKTATSIDFESRNSEYVLATNATHTALYIFENVRTGKVKAVLDKNGICKGFQHELVQYEIPTLELKKIGSLITIRYHSMWWEGELKEYRHDFDSAQLWADKQSRFKTIGITPKRGKILSSDGFIG
jgi:hypothetical protein